MKAFTDIKQSRKLAEILPPESADMKYPYFGDEQYGRTAVFGEPIEFSGGKDIPCWSLAALLDILRNSASSIDEDADVSLSSYKTVEWWDLLINNSGLEAVTKSDPIDACVEMIVKLKENNLI